MQKRIVVTNIQRFSIHDGPGIRSTVFLKGCAICCPWCSNPENINREIQEYNRNGFAGIYGRRMSAEELVDECRKDKAYYGESEKSNWNIKRIDEMTMLPGGVTFSGGEALLQMENLVPVCKALHSDGIHIAIETSLFAPCECVQLAIENVDLFYCDVKIMNKDKAKIIEKADLGIFLNNFELLMESEVPVIIRIPVIGGKTDDIENRREIRSFLNMYKSKIIKIELIKGHDLARNKYESLGMEVEYEGVSDDLMNQYKNELDCLGMIVEILEL